MTTRQVLLALAGLATLACSQKRIPHTQIEATDDNRAVWDVVEAYRQAMERRDAAGVLALVAPDYFDTGGTTDPTDDLDRGRLEASLTEHLSRTEGLRLDITLRKIEVEGDRAEAEIFYDSYYRVKTPTIEVPRHDSDVHRMKLQRIEGTWKIVAGL